VCQLLIKNVGLIIKKFLPIFGPHCLPIFYFTRLATLVKLKVWQFQAVVLESKEQFERESGILESAPVKNEDTDKLSHFAPNTCQSPFARCSPASARQTICRSWRIANQQEASNSSVILGQSSAGPEKRVLDALDDGKNRPALSSFECLKQDALLNSRCTVSLLKNHGVDRRSNRSQLMQNDEIYNRSSVITYASSSTPEVCVGVKEVHQEDCNGNYKVSWKYA
jgi:hypothetical protein